jgi:hypothetical protein
VIESLQLMDNPLLIINRSQNAALPHNQLPELGLDQPRMSLFTNRPTSGVLPSSSVAGMDLKFYEAGYYRRI